MFQATILPIMRSIRLYNAACDMKHPVSCQPVLMLLMMGRIVAQNMSS